MSQQVQKTGSIWVYTENIAHNAPMPAGLASASIHRWISRLAVDAMTEVWAGQATGPGGPQAAGEQAHPVVSQCQPPGGCTVIWPRLRGQYGRRRSDPQRSVAPRCLGIGLAGQRSGGAAG